MPHHYNDLPRFGPRPPRLRPPGPIQDTNPRRRDQIRPISRIDMLIQQYIKNPADAALAGTLRGALGLGTFLPGRAGGYFRGLDDDLSDIVDYSGQGIGTAAELLAPDPTDLVPFLKIAPMVPAAWRHYRNRDRLYAPLTEAQIRRRSLESARRGRQLSPFHRLLNLSSYQGNVSGALGGVNTRKLESYGDAIENYVNLDTGELNPDQFPFYLSRDVTEQGRATTTHRQGALFMAPLRSATYGFSSHSPTAFIDPKPESIQLVPSPFSSGPVVAKRRNRVSAREQKRLVEGEREAKSRGDYAAVRYYRTQAKNAALGVPDEAVAGWAIASDNRDKLTVFASPERLTEIKEGLETFFRKYPGQAGRSPPIIGHEVPGEDWADAARDLAFNTPDKYKAPGMVTDANLIHDPSAAPDPYYRINTPDPITPDPITPDPITPATTPAPQSRVNETVRQMNERLRAEQLAVERAAAAADPNAPNPFEVTPDDPSTYTISDDTPELPTSPLPRASPGSEPELIPNISTQGTMPTARDRWPSGNVSLSGWNEFASTHPQHQALSNEIAVIKDHMRLNPDTYSPLPGNSSFTYGEGAMNFDLDRMILGAFTSPEVQRHVRPTTHQGGPALTSQYSLDVDRIIGDNHGSAFRRVTTVEQFGKFIEALREALQKERTYYARVGGRQARNRLDTISDQYRDLANQTSSGSRYEAQLPLQPNVYVPIPPVSP